MHNGVLCGGVLGESAKGSSLANRGEAFELLFSGAWSLVEDGGDDGLPNSHFGLPNAPVQAGGKFKSVWVVLVALGGSSHTLDEFKKLPLCRDKGYCSTGLTVAFTGPTVFLRLDCESSSTIPLAYVLSQWRLGLSFVVAWSAAKAGPIVKRVSLLLLLCSRLADW